MGWHEQRNDWVSKSETGYPTHRGKPQQVVWQGAWVPGGVKNYGHSVIYPNKHQLVWKETRYLAIFELSGFRFSALHVSVRDRTRLFLRKRNNLRYSLSQYFCAFGVQLPDLVPVIWHTCLEAWMWSWMQRSKEESTQVVVETRPSFRRTGRRY